MLSRRRRRHGMPFSRPLELTARSWRSPYDTPLPATSGSIVPASMPSRIARAARRNGVLAFSPVKEDVSTKRTPGVSSAERIRRLGRTRCADDRRADGDVATALCATRLPAAPRAAARVLHTPTSLPSRLRRSLARTHHSPVPTARPRHTRPPGRPRGRAYSPPARARGAHSQAPAHPAPSGRGWQTSFGS